MSYERYSCPNENCKMHGQVGAGNIGHRCWYGKNKERELLRCKICKKTFSAERDTAFHHSKLSKEKFCQILECLCQKAGVRGTARIVGVGTNTVLRVIRIAAAHFEAVSRIMIRDINVTEVQMDEFWSFIKKKEKNASEDEIEQGEAGDRYTYVSMDAASRLIISIATGRRIQETADTMLQALKLCLSCAYVTCLTLILFTSDAWDQYYVGLKKIFGFWHRPRRRRRTGRRRNFRQYIPWNLLYATVEKIKDGAGKVTRVIRTVVHGSSDLVEQVIQDSSVSSTINTAFVERINATFRAFCSRLVRKSCSFSKKSSYHDAHIKIVTAFYNFVHPHRTLTESNGRNTSPAMEAGLTNHCWSLMELCSFPVSRASCQ